MCDGLYISVGGSQMVLPVIADLLNLPIESRNPGILLGVGILLVIYIVDMPTVHAGCIRPILPTPRCP